MTVADYNRLISEEKKKQAAIRAETAKIRAQTAHIYAQIAEIKGKEPSPKATPIKWSLNDLPDIYSMSSDQLVWLRKDAEKKMEVLEKKEPDFDDDIRYEKWEEKHDELQNLLDDLEELIQEKYEDELEL